MLEKIEKNLWLMLTVILPGICTYGAWRLLLILNHSQILDSDAFTTIDKSGIITTCMIISIALIQQAIGISIEFILSLIARKTKKYWEGFYSLFWDRFKFASVGLLNENSTRIIGNFFLSINIFVGFLLLLSYFSLYETLKFDHWILKILVFILIFNLATIIFRMLNAISLIRSIFLIKDHQMEISSTMPKDRILFNLRKK